MANQSDHSGRALGSSTGRPSKAFRSSAFDEPEAYLDNRTQNDGREFDSASVGLQMRQMNEDVRVLRCEFTDTLKRLEPHVSGIMQEMSGVRSDISDIKVTLAGLPGKATIWGAGIAFIAIFVTIASPKEFWGFLTELAKHWN